MNAAYTIMSLQNARYRPCRLMGLSTYWLGGAIQPWTLEVLYNTRATPDSHSVVPKAGFVTQTARGLVRVQYAKEQIQVSKQDGIFSYYQLQVFLELS